MLTQAQNEVYIEGILSEKNLIMDEFNGDSRIRGSITVQVDQNIGGTDVVTMVPVQFYAMKHTKSGTVNSSYQNLMDVIDNYKSIAESNAAEADRVRLTSRYTSINMNEYPSQSGAIISQIRFRGSYLSKVTGAFKPRTEFTLGFVLSSMNHEIGPDGEETVPAKLVIKAIVPDYRGKISVVPLTTTNPSIIHKIESECTEGGCYTFTGRINFTDTVVTTVVEQDFGDPIERSHHRTLRELVITGGSTTDSEAWDTAEVAAAVKEYKAELDQKKSQNLTKAAPAQTSKVAFDLGF